jgi:5-methylcytosine-specific restriction protein A
MTIWIIPANPKIYDHASSFEHHTFIDWRQGNGKFKVGDIIFIYITRPTSMLQYKCIVSVTNLVYPNIRNDIEYWKDKNDYYKSLKGKFMRLEILEQVYNPKMSLSNLMANGLNAAPQGPVKVKQQLYDYISLNFSDNHQIETFPDILDDRTDHFEGIKKLVLVNKYERSSIARQKCIEYRGLNCHICDMNFANIYGEIGIGFIHVHHLIPIHKIGTEYKINYEADLIPVCPNCHAMLHRKIDGKEPTIEELKGIIIKQIRLKGENIA